LSLSVMKKSNNHRGHEGPRKESHGFTFTPDLKVKLPHV
jgi:hypothetical protein